MQDVYKKIYPDPRFHALERKRRVFTWVLAGVVFANSF